MARRSTPDPGRDDAAERPLILRIRVRPRARVSELAQEADGTWVARLKAPPVDGKANEELVRLIAERFQCGRAAVTIRSGATGRIKLVQVTSRPS